MNWREQAEAVGAAIPAARQHPAVREWIGTGRSRRSWAVAFSGGADSLALLLVLWSQWPHRRERLFALHYNHRRRGARSDGDERFCREVCRKLGMRCIVGRRRRSAQGASEAQLRTDRHRFFASAMRRIGSRWLWLGHQQDDVAESMLMRLARGSGTAGLAAPRPAQEFPDGRVHLRPLLTIGHAEIEKLLRERKVPWRTDASNFADDYFRNRIRRTVLPGWRNAARRDALAGAGLSRDLLEEDDRALEAWADGLGALRGGELDLTACHGKPRAVTRRLLHRWLLAVQVDTDLSRQGFSALLSAAERAVDTRFSLGSAFAVIRDGKLRLKRGAKVPISP